MGTEADDNESAFNAVFFVVFLKFWMITSKTKEGAFYVSTPANFFSSNMIYHTLQFRFRRREHIKEYTYYAYISLKVYAH